MKRIIGEIQRRIMIFGLSSNYVYSLTGIVIGALSVYLDVNKTGNLGVQVGRIEIFIIILSLLSIVYKFIVETNELNQKNNEFIEVERKVYRDRIRNKICLSEKHIESGYKIHAFNDEKYVMSNDVNRIIYSMDKRLKLKYSGKFILSNEVKEIVPFALNAAFSRKSTIFNSRLIRLTDEIYSDGNPDIRIHSTDYFQGLCTNEMVYTKLRSILKMQEPIVFFGEKLLLNDENEVVDLSESFCSNYLGGSTLAVTKDRCIIINSQSDKSDTNSGRFAPSGSGSTDYRDYKRLKKTKKNADERTFQELVKITMERELREECGLIGKRVKVNSKVIGFARLLERGGKPDFFGITYVDEYFDKIKISKKEVIDIGKYEIKRIQFNEYKDIPDKLYEFIGENPGKISIQIKILAEILKHLYDKGMDPFAEITF